MLFLLRKIRRKLISPDNKVLTYLLYAIGEIFLVVVGILIAVQIDEWNGARKDKVEEQVILQSLKEEFEQNLLEVTRAIGINENSIRATVQMMDMVRDGQIFNDPDTRDSLFVGAMFFSSYDAQTGYFNQISNSGKLVLIGDERLRKQLTSWPSQLKNMQEDYQIRVDQYNLIVLPYYQKYFPMANGELYSDFTAWSSTYKTVKLKKSPFHAERKDINLMELENVFWQFKLNNDFVNLNEQDLRKYILETLEMINLTLEKFES
jgi:hypothetical protein